MYVVNDNVHILILLIKPISLVSFSFLLCTFFAVCGMLFALNPYQKNFNIYTIYMQCVKCHVEYKQNIFTFV